MAVGNPAITHDDYGERYLFWTDGTAVKFMTNLRLTPITAFSQEEADGPIDVVIDRTGLITVTYIETDGDRATKSSDRDGNSGTWS